jgi:hypothetical protein
MDVHRNAKRPTHWLLTALLLLVAPLAMAMGLNNSLR